MALIDPEFSHTKFAKLTRSISRNQASILFQLRSGHVPLNTYLHRIKKVDSPICQSCLQFRETVMHYVMRCETHTIARRTMFNAAGRDARNLGKLLSTTELLPHLFQFIKSTERLRLSRERNAVVWSDRTCYTYSYILLIIFYSHTFIRILLHAGSPLWATLRVALSSWVAHYRAEWSILGIIYSFVDVHHMVYHKGQ